MKDKIIRKGATLIELVIVLALTSIISVSVLTLINTTNNVVVKAKEISLKEENIAFFRKFITNWFSSFDKKENLYTIVDNELIIEEDGVNYTIDIIGNDITAHYKSENKTTSFDGLESIVFNLVSDTNNLYKCTVTYKINDDLTSYSFLISRRSA